MKNAFRKLSFNVLILYVPVREIDKHHREANEWRQMIARHVENNTMRQGQVAHIQCPRKIGELISPILRERVKNFPGAKYN